MELPVRTITAHPYVLQNHCRIALQRGPLLFSAEQADNADMDFVIAAQPRFQVRESPAGGERAIAITAETTDGAKAIFIPYYLWCNRQKGRMDVWVKQDRPQPDLKDTKGWEDCLYRYNVAF